MNTLQRTYQNGVINCSGVGDNEIHAAVVGKKIVVMHYFFTVESTVVATWKSGTDSLSGPMTLTVGANPSSGESVLATGVNKALILSLATGVRCAGHYTYYEE